MEPTESDPTGAGSGRSRLNSTIAAAGVAFGLTLAGLGIAAAQTDPDPGTTTTTQAPAEGDGARPAETALTGDVAEKVKAAALAEVPGGTVVRVETDADGSPYEAHVRKEDGTEVVVKVDEAFAVTSVEEGRMGHHGGGHHGGGGPADTPLTGEAADKATAAAQAAVEGGTVERVEADRDGSGYHAHVRRADGTHIVVRMDGSFAVTGTEERAGGRHGPRPGETTPPTTTA